MPEPPPELPRIDDPVRLSANLKQVAHAAGFDDCRIAGAGPPRHWQRFEDWLNEGCHGDMDYLDTERSRRRRADPREVLPGARAMVVVALNYFQGTPPPSPAGVAGGAIGRVARYAWGDDYHDMIEQRLRDVAVFMEQQGGEQRVYVDTGPVLERDFASEAGLGWNGKSTVQIHRRLGTWFFLGEILTTLPLPPDPPENDHCGRCTRCIDACPTNAITGPREMDARRCISYLTIEHKGSIPMEFRRAIGDRIYGCDECLTVCPWNRFARVSHEAGFQLREVLATTPLRQWLEIDQAGFSRAFRHSPIKRVKRDRWLRNVCVALGNIGSREDLPALHRAIGREGALVAEHARWAVDEIGRRHPARAAAPSAEREPSINPAGHPAGTRA